MKHQIAKSIELTGPALAWAVAITIGYEGKLRWIPSIRALIDDSTDEGSHYDPAGEFSIGGWLLDEYRISTFQSDLGGWSALPRGWLSNPEIKEPYVRGATLLEAGMRALVASEWGDTISIPEDILAAAAA